MLFTFVQLIYSVMMYLFFIVASPYFIIKVMTTEKYRSGIRYRLGYLSDELKCALNNGPNIWVHAVSVGEVQAALPLIETLKETYLSHNVILSATTLTGFTVAKRATESDPRVAVTYFPLDFWHTFHRIFSRHRIDLIIIIETEIWPNFLMEAYIYRIPVILANGRISASSFRGYRLVSWMFRACTRSIEYFCMQTDHDASRIRQLGIDEDRIHLCGNIKYEMLLKLPVNRTIGTTLMRTASWSANDPVWLIGSTHRGEEELICSVYTELRRTIGNLRMIVAPRHPERIEEVAAILTAHQIPFYRKTELDTAPAPVRDCRVVLLDTMGELRHLYTIATVAFVGKSMVAPGGGQNVLEPASLGVASVFGPYMDNFAAVADKLVAAQGGIMVHSRDELLDQTRRLLTDSSHRTKTGANARAEVERWQGATDCILSCVNEVLPINH